VLVHSIDVSDDLASLLGWRCLSIVIWLNLKRYGDRPVLNIYDSKVKIKRLFNREMVHFLKKKRNKTELCFIRKPRWLYRLIKDKAEKGRAERKCRRSRIWDQKLWSRQTASVGIRSRRGILPAQFFFILFERLSVHFLWQQGRSGRHLFYFNPMPGKSSSCIPFPFHGQASSIEYSRTIALSAHV